MRLLVILDRQHTGKSAAPRDTGGASQYSGKTEAEMVHRYLMTAEWALRGAGIDVMPLSDGSYTDRHARSKLYATGYSHAIYVAGHLNAGEGDYAAVFNDHRSSMGEEVAVKLSHRLGACLPEIMGSKVIGARPGHWTSNAFYTIRGVYSGRPCGICYEPAFMDNEDHAPLLEPEGLDRIGMCLADGILDWVDSS